MKHLKRFNEELNKYTYKSASTKLKALGHVRRSKNIDDFIIKKEEQEKIDTHEKGISSWKKNINNYSKYGKFRFNITKKSKDGQHILNILTDEFYVKINFEPSMFLDNLHEYKDNDGSFDIESNIDTNLSFSLCIIPVNEESLNNCLNKFKENNIGFDDFYGGFYTNWIYFPICTDGDKITIGSIDMDQDEEYGRVTIADRNSAGRFKKLLFDIFKGSDYPTGLGGTLHDQIESEVCNISGLSSEFGLDMDHFASAVNRTRTNHLFKEIL